MCHLVWHAASVDTLCVRSYALSMPRHPSPAPGELHASTPGDDAAIPAPPAPTGGSAAATPSRAGLGVVGLSRRRIAWVAVVALAAWIVIAFAGQAASASEATARVADARARNAAVTAQTEALRGELGLVTQERWILQQARAYQLGSRKERPFAIEPDAPAVPADAPGSAARRLGAETVAPSPLEVWLEVLFGPRG
jgi:hypothetical protein